MEIIVKQQHSDITHWQNCFTMDKNGKYLFGGKVTLGRHQLVATTSTRSGVVVFKVK
jgi:hypothetical protein